MADTHKNSELNQLLIRIRCTLLQFIGETSPWTELDAEADRKAFQQALETQQANLTCVIELLVARRWTIDFGIYPAEFTDLHFIALDYLLPSLVEGQQQLVSDVEQTQKAGAGDAEAQDLLKKILSSEQEILKSLEALAKSRSVGSAA